MIFEQALLEVSHEDAIVIKNNCPHDVVVFDNMFEKILATDIVVTGEVIVMKWAPFLSLLMTTKMLVYLPKGGSNTMKSMLRSSICDQVSIVEVATVFFIGVLMT